MDIRTLIETNASSSLAYVYKDDQRVQYGTAKFRWSEELLHFPDTDLFGNLCTLTNNILQVSTCIPIQMQIDESMATQQINLKMPEELATIAKKFAKKYGYRNIQDLALHSLREKIYEKSSFDTSFSTKEIEFIDKLLARSIQNNTLIDEDTFMKKLKQ